MKAKEIMHKNVITVKPEMTLQELAKIFDDHHITGAPVTSAQGNLVGVVSQTDLVRHDRETPPTEVPSYHRQAENEQRQGGFHTESPDYTKIEEVMTPWVISFEEDTPVEELARQMLRKHIHRIVVTRDGQLSGIVSTMDVVRGLLAIIEKSHGKNGAKTSRVETSARARR